MEITLKIPDYAPSKGIEYQWENGLDIDVKLADKCVCIAANREGLISLANHLLNLAQEEVPAGYHIHLDEHNSLSDGSFELIVQKNKTDRHLSCSFMCPRRA